MKLSTIATRMPLWYKGGRSVYLKGCRHPYAFDPCPCRQFVRQVTSRGNS